MKSQNTRANINALLGALTVAAAFASVPAFAQEVWQTYPQTISTPAFGPGPVQPYTAPVTRPARPARAERPVYNSADRFYSSPQGGRACEVWQTYPGTISTPAYGHYDETCQD